MTVAGLREWLTDWIVATTGLARGEVDPNRPMEEFGLSSRDAVALSGEIEDLCGITLDATIVYQHPTIASLAQRIVEGPPESADVPVDENFYTRPSGPGAHDVAIIGMASRFPGSGSTPAQMWEMLAAGHDGITDLPAGRWDEYRSDPVIAAAIERANTKGGYLEDVKGFDAEFFAMSPREVEMVDPQQRLALELTWEALEHAHLPANTLKGQSVGVFMGSSANDYQLLTVADPSTAHPYAITGNSTAIIANRISYFYDFRGPSVTLDTACSSSLVAVHQAVRALREGDADLAVAGGTNMLVAPAATLGFSELGVMAPDGRIKAFSSDADGMIRSEGGGLLVLKRLEDAERDGDTVLAVIAGTAVNQDGRSNGLTAPSPDAQVDVLRRAYRDAGIVPTQVDYIEAHGTGTTLGDPIEAGALGRVVGLGREDDKPALLGSAKTNFGHLEAAAGAAGMIKVVLSMQADALPPTLNYAGPNPLIDFDAAHLRVIDEGAQWPRYSGQAIAGVSGFGFGGTNAHVVLREYTPAAVEVPAVEAPVADEAAEPPAVLLVVSAPMPSRRRRVAADLADWLETEAGSVTSLEDLGRALARRNHGRSRGAVLARTRAEAIAGLHALAAGKPSPHVLSADSPATSGPVWVFSGFGSQHRKMGKSLYQTNSVFHAAVDEIDEFIDIEAGYRVAEMFLDDSVDYDTERAQVGIFTIQVALAKLLRHHGAEPTAALGHSMGEAAAAYVSGGLSLEDAVRVICVRSRLMGEGEATLEGQDIRRMAIVEYSAAEITDVLVDFPDLEVCVYAAPNQTVIGGPDPQVQAIVARAEAAGKFARVMQVKGASHTSQVDPILGEFQAELAGIENFPLATGLFSSVHEGNSFPAGHDPLHAEDYWIKGMRHSVFFDQAVKAALSAGHTTFVELAPNPVTLMSIAMTCYDQGVLEPQLVQTLKRKEDEELTVLTALATLYVHGHQVDLDSLLPAGPFAEIPRTAFQRKQLWVNSRISTGGNARIPGAHVALPDGRHVWEVVADAVTDPAQLIVAAAGEVLSDVTLGAVLLGAAAVPMSGTITTSLVPHLGGGSVQVHARGADGAFTLLAEAVVHSGAPLAERVVLAPVLAEQVVAEDADDDFGAASRWDPEGKISLDDRLREIVAESMGFAAEDLPMEIPLMELGLDSLMAVRIKNRVEYDFDIPQLQLQAVRDANLVEVAKYVHYAVENREEVAALAEQQRREAETGGVAGETVTAIPTDLPADVPEAAAETAAAPAEKQAADVPPRDAAERLTFGTWAVVIGRSARGIFNPLTPLDDAQTAALAERLTERAGGDITAEQVRGATTIEQLSDLVREHLEGDVGIVRTLRAKVEGVDRVPVFVFHPAGGSTVAYEPLLKRLPADTPMYGFERVEGEIAERATQYLEPIREIQAHGPYVLAGWSFGGILAYAVAKLLRAAGEEVALVGLIDVVMPGEEIVDNEDERRARWNRYIAFAEKTYGVEVPLPVDLLAQTDDEGAVDILMGLLKGVDLPIPGGVIEHQRTSFLENRALARAAAQLTPYDGPTVLYMADTYHDGAIELEPAYATRAADGGWGGVLTDLEVVQIGGDHVAIVDEPYIAKVGAHLSRKLAEIESARG
ncbi:polyketide synthase Pks13 [Tomitella biformata]|uniref:polyketide synthase Pks13 n=1 Tax=Tomitella biformata TaxID=630403 RepID=UPI00046334A3|nr:polyketide synthase Pks13 [Tomitella biformata]